MACDSDLRGDPRVLRQIGWLVDDGWIVDSLGHGPRPAQLNGDHVELRRRDLVARLLAYALLPSKARFDFLIGYSIPVLPVQRGGADKYDLLLVNDMELLPWATDAAPSLVKPAPEGRFHLDLHEFAPSQAKGLRWRLLFRRYQRWSIRFIPSPAITSRSTVAPGIAKLYGEYFSIPPPAVVRSSPAFLDLSPAPVEPSNIRLIHHGKADLDRNPGLLIEAMKLIDERFTLTLMLVGSPRIVKSLKAAAAPLGSRVVFVPPVAVHDVSQAVNAYDLEVIFFPPTTLNLKHALPNKFFESVQGRLGIVIGQSPEMIDLVDHYALGVVVPEWTAEALASTVNRLTAERVAGLKQAADEAAHDLSAEAERDRFFASIAQEASRMAHPLTDCTALVVCFSDLERDPRVIRQIDWLISDGWTVDTLGLGSHPRPSVREHFRITEAPAFTRPAIVKAGIHATLPYRARFDLLMGSRIPKALTARSNVARYDLVLVNDMDLLPWVHRSAPALLKPGGHAHLDVHEYHAWAPPARGGRAARALLSGYHRWTKGFVASPVFATRSTVADGIADLYSAEYGIPRPVIVRNAPEFVPQQPTAVDPDRVELIYHGKADLKRGLSLLVDAVELLESRFHLTFMLTGAESGKNAIRELTHDLRERVTLVEPVPMEQVAHRINAFDLEVMFFPPVTENLRNALPNKLFEAVQGRLGLVIGESPEMMRITSRYGNGIVVPEWTAESLAATLNAIDAAHVAELKARSDAAAGELCSAAERERFLASIVVT